MLSFVKFKTSTLIVKNNSNFPNLSKTKAM